jgi:hypothetical protein
MFEESDVPYSTSSTPPDPELASLFFDPVVPLPMSVFPFSAGFPGRTPSLVPSAAPHAALVPFAAPLVASVPPPTPRGTASVWSQCCD